MSKTLKARVLAGRYKDSIVRVTNISTDELGKKNAACFLPDGGRANIKVSDLEFIEETPEPVKENHFPKTSMPFISGSSSSRTLTHTKNMQKPRIQIKPKNEDDEDEE